MRPDAPVRRIALLVEYEGTAYGGSQYQTNAPTVQGSLERALSNLTREPIRMALAGRTDAGVHARGQVASFATASRHTVDVIVRAVNAHLPADIAVRAAAEVPAGFDPRRHAVSRWYRYTMHLGKARPALLRRFVWHLAAPPDVGMMAEAARLLPGKHDLAAFVAPSEARRRPTERVVMRAEVRRKGDLALFDIEANAFLHHMVRRIVGALVEVGLGKRSTAEFEALLEARPGVAGYMALARGLCLMKVRYESELFDVETDEDIQP